MEATSLIYLKEYRLDLVGKIKFQLKGFKDYKYGWTDNMWLDSLKSMFAWNDHKLNMAGKSKDYIYEDKMLNMASYKFM